VSARRVFLVTGATGAVGSAIVPLLLAESGTRVFALLRAASDEALANRIRALLDYWGHRVDPAGLSDRLVGIRGDVGQARLGMSEQDFTVLARSVTNVVHSAGNVRLNQSIEKARASAVFAAEEVVRFARACGEAGVLPKIEYLSTVGVAGRRPGLISEEPLDDAAGYHNTYEQAKAEAEQLVLREVRAGLPATIHRPSMVVGDSVDGRIIHFQVFYYLAPFLAGSRTRGILPEFGAVKLDLVPADYVAKAVVAATRRQDSLGRILHLCSGPAQAAPLIELGETLRRFLAAKGERTFAPRYLPRALVRQLIRIAGAVVPGRVGRSLDTLPYFLDYLDEAQLFANHDTADFFAQDGLAVPPVERFLPAILDYWYARRRR
jgi:thioester reductase-like protein